MSKYIDADKLKAEIERRKEKWLAASRLIKKGKDKAMYAAGKSSGYTEFFSLINSLQQEQPEVLSGEDVMVVCNQILIDWVKEGNTQEEKEQREQAHIRFFELYDDYLVQEQPEVELEKASRNVYESWKGGTMDDFLRDMVELGKALNARKEE